MKVGLLSSIAIAVFICEIGLAFSQVNDELDKLMEMENVSSSNYDISFNLKEECSSEKEFYQECEILQSVQKNLCHELSSDQSSKICDRIKNFLMNKRVPPLGADSLDLTPSLFLAMNLSLENECSSLRSDKAINLCFSFRNYFLLSNQDFDDYKKIYRTAEITREFASHFFRINRDREKGLIWAKDSLSQLDKFNGTELSSFFMIHHLSLTIYNDKLLPLYRDSYKALSFNPSDYELYQKHLEYIRFQMKIKFNLYTYIALQKLQERQKTERHPLTFQRRSQMIYEMAEKLKEGIDELIY